MCARDRGCPPHARATSRDSAGWPQYSGPRESGPAPIQDSLSQLPPEARWSLLPLPAPRLKLVPANAATRNQLFY